MATPPVMKIVEPYTPELLESAQRWISEWIWQQKFPPVKVLEFGSGWSTIWFAGMDCIVTSVEHHSGWYHEVVSKLHMLDLDRLTRMYLHHPQNYYKVFDSWKEQEFDIVYVDCIDEYRVDVAQKSLQLLKPDGILILDDTHWSLWKPFVDRLNKDKHYYMENVFDGMHKRKDGETHYHHTTVFRKVS